MRGQGGDEEGRSSKGEGEEKKGDEMEEVEEKI